MPKNNKMEEENKKNKNSSDVSVKQKVDIKFVLSILVIIGGALAMAGGFFMVFSKLISSTSDTKIVETCPQVTAEQLARTDDVAMYYQKMESGFCENLFSTKTGKVRFTAADNLDTGENGMAYSLTIDGNKYSLFFKGNLNSDINSGDIITVSGYSIENEKALLVDAADISFDQDKTDNPYSPAVGNYETIVIKSLFSNSNENIPNNSDVREALDNNQSFYLENSYGDLLYQGAVEPNKSADIYGWYRINDPMPHNAGISCDNYDEVADYTVQSVVDYVYENQPEINFEQYDSNGTLIIITHMGCSFAGLGYYGPQEVMLPNGEIIELNISIIEARYTSTSYLTRHIAHELGHTLGHSHAAYYGCNIYKLPFDPLGCDLYNNYLGEYGDYFEVMGQHAVRHFNAKHKQESGWFDDWNPVNGEGRRALITEENITQDGLYTLEPVETNANGLKALMIPRADEDTYLYVEFRQPIGWDIGMNPYPYEDNNIYEGALLHIDAGMLETSYGSVDFSFLFMPDGERLPYSYRYGGYPALGLGQKFTDPETYTSVTVEAINRDTQNPENSTITVKVVFNDMPTCDNPDSYICGDVNLDHIVSIDDAVYMVNALFKGGPDPLLDCSVDLNAVDGFNVEDIVIMVDYLFRGGPLPTCQDDGVKSNETITEDEVDQLIDDYYHNLSEQK